MLVEHPTGASPVAIEVDETGGRAVVAEAGIISTARLLFRGEVCVPARAHSHVAA
jgi:2-methylaconitate cis-trans-isomerase PrpF